MVAEAVRSAAFDEIFHRPLIQFPFTHPFDKILQGFEGTALLTLGNHGADQTHTNIFHRAKAKTNGIPLRYKGILRMIDIRRQNRNPPFFTLGNILGNLDLIAKNACEKRCKILSGIMRLKIRGSV